MSRHFLSCVLLGALLGACKDPDDENYLGPTGPMVASVHALDLRKVPAVVAATHVFWRQVQLSAPADRMAPIVDEIDRRRPHARGRRPPRARSCRRRPGATRP